jgi:4-amino-4-deoxy-L-arabinose transferase-like glycosyltransferase
MVSLAQSHRASLEHLEPPIIETLSALAYRAIGAEVLWAARLYSIVFWLIASVLVFLLARKVLRVPRPGFSPGATAALALFLFFPLGIFGSRSFQPDPLMVLAIVATLFALFRWDEAETVSSRWRWALAAAVLGSFAIIVKGVGLFFVGPATAALVLSNTRIVESFSQLRVPALLKKVRLPAIKDIKAQLRNPQIWIIAVVMLVPGLIYYASVASGNQSLLSRSIISRLGEVVSPSFWIRWMIFLDGLIGLPWLFASLLSFWLATRRGKAVLAALWLGYGLYGMAFPKLIITHDYYHLPLIPILALSLAPAADRIARWVVAEGLGARLMLATVFTIGIGYSFWITRSVMLAEDYREAGVYWQVVGEAIPTQGKAVGYSQDYGFRLTYYGWRRIDVWPRDMDVREFKSRIEKVSYFVVTAKNQMSDDLAAHLDNQYPVLESGGGYTIYDLRESP